MTEGTPASDPGIAFRKAVKARNLVDPLGAMGFRQPAARIERERRARRAVFVAALATFAGLFGLVVATSPSNNVQPQAAEAGTVEVLAEVPIASTDPNGPVTIIRIVGSQVQPHADVRTSQS